jgi:hypothetical protein
MEETKLGSFKEQYQKNKKEMIRSKKSKIVSLELMENLKSTKDGFQIEIELCFDVENSIQKIVFNQGILLSYKISKFIEKEKFKIFNAFELKSITEIEYTTAFFILNLFVNNEIEKTLNENSERKSNYNLYNISLN